MKSNVRMIDKQGGSIMVSEATKAKKAIWNKENSKHYGFRLSNNNDIEIINFLDNSVNKADTIRQALLFYMEAQKKDL